MESHPILEPPASVFDNLETLVSLSNRDWAQDKTDAWIYGIILGWTDDPDEDTDGLETLRQIGAKHGWSSARIEQLCTLRRQWLEARNPQPHQFSVPMSALEPLLADLESRGNAIHAKGGTSLNSLRNAGRADGYLEAVRAIRRAAGL